MRKYYIGSTPYFEATVKTRAGALVAPTGLDIQIEDKNAKVILAWAAMSTSVTGIYYYNTWTVATSHTPGTYRARVKVTDTAVITIDEDCEKEFQVMGR